MRKGERRDLRALGQPGSGSGVLALGEQGRIGGEHLLVHPSVGAVEGGGGQTSHSACGSETVFISPLLFCSVWLTRTCITCSLSAGLLAWVFGGILNEPSVL